MWILVKKYSNFHEALARCNYEKQDFFQFLCFEGMIKSQCHLVINSRISLVLGTNWWSAKLKSIKKSFLYKADISIWGIEIFAPISCPLLRDLMISLHHKIILWKYEKVISFFIPQSMFSFFSQSIFFLTIQVYVGRRSWKDELLRKKKKDWGLSRKY